MRIDKFQALLDLLQREFDPRETLLLLKLNQPRFMSWGVHNLVYLQNKALLFSVNGHHHKGKILITLAWDDTYSVTLINTKNNIKETFTEIYCDDLAEFIDHKIEYIPLYEDR
jgi:hypothetical protein